MEYETEFYKLLKLAVTDDVALIRVLDKIMKLIYSWEQVRAYSIIALHNLLNSANDINLKNMKLFIDPLQTLYGKDGIVGVAERLINNE